MKKQELKMKPERALEIAREAHKDQVDLSGKPYIHHVERVVGMLMHPVHRMLGALHDVVEDSDWTFEMLADEGLPREMIYSLTALTRGPNESYDDYIVAIGANFDATIVKLADLRDNMDITRLETITDKDVERLRRYHNAYTYLKERAEVFLAIIEEEENKDAAGQ